MFFGVVGALAVFYSYLAWRSLVWSPMFYVKHADSERSKITLSDRPREARPLTFVERGAESYRQAGCGVCHGSEGRGGVINPNYVKGTTPALDQLAERMFLQEPEDLAKVVAALESGNPLKADGLDVPRAAAVVAQYESVRDVILKGNPAGKKDPSGAKPLDMPAWHGWLAPSEIDSIIAYLLSLRRQDKQPNDKRSD